MDTKVFLPQRSIHVVQRGNDIFAGRQWLDARGRPGAKIFDRHIGTTSCLPFDDTVRDWKGSKIGVLKELPGGIKTLRRW